MTTQRNDRTNTAVVFVAGSGHSGSTLLGLMLGAHPGVFYAGEAKKTTKLGNERVPLRKRVCKLCGSGCPVWGDMPRFEDTHGAEAADLYETLSRRTTRPVVVDSAKNVLWIERQATALRGSAATHLILLSRDGRAVVNSYARKYPEVAVREHASAWASRMRAAEGLAGRWEGGQVCRLRYEELATAPEETMRRVSGALGLAFDPGMLAPWSAEQHPLGGNEGTHSLVRREHPSAQGPGTFAAMFDTTRKTLAWYDDQPTAAIRLDLRWQREMSAAALAEFDAVAGAANRSYAWEPA